jgi:hypothetical protein
VWALYAPNELLCSGFDDSGRMVGNPSLTGLRKGCPKRYVVMARATGFGCPLLTAATAGILQKCLLTAVNPERIR